ncbi:hypothetical protein [Xanthomonas fragariae]|uniref:hypothetical protein n=1 Tax=Xanthomonas fragariae TaxID=48664 RepID=UPI0003A3F434|nr:hypothetical protein [Xanthomonas fragariae]MDM7581373.1 hypothetical protein [Xanthomonas fragariae]MDM7588564.1 hypothetical protein [Xanthomonas fragariae]MEA5249603.1 hypothetical protein [Xanthomonas fragariae]
MIDASDGGETVICGHVCMRTAVLGAMRHTQPDRLAGRAQQRHVSGLRDTRSARSKVQDGTIDA